MREIAVGVVGDERPNVDILLALTHIDFDGTLFRPNRVTGCTQLIEPANSADPIHGPMGLPIDIAICGHDHVEAVSSFSNRGDGKPSFAFEAGSSLTCSSDSPFSRETFCTCKDQTAENSCISDPLILIPRPRLAHVQFEFQNGAAVMRSAELIDLAPRYHATWDYQSPEYSDNGPPLVMSWGQTKTFVASFRNLGSRTWFKHTLNGDFTQVRLGLVDDDSIAPLATNTSIPFVPIRLAELQEESVAPGKVGHFIFNITIPQGTEQKIYNLRVAPVAESILPTFDWMNEGDTAHWKIRVSAK